MRKRDHGGKFTSDKSKENTKAKHRDLVKNDTGVYLVEYENGVKIGVSDTLKTRLRVYEQPWCREVIGICVIYTKNKINPYDLEETLLSFFENKESEFVFNTKVEDIIQKLIDCVENYKLSYVNRYDNEALLRYLLLVKDEYKINAL